MARELVIDLGDDFTPAADSRLAREWSGRSRRTAAVVIVAVVALLALTGSAVRATPVAPKIATIDAAAGGTFIIVGANIVVADIRDGHNAMTAYRLATGEQLWTTRLAVLANGLDMQRVGNVVVAAFRGLDGFSDRTEGVDLRTGAKRWISPSELVRVYASTGTALLHDHEQFSMIDVASGRALWTRDVDVVCNTNLEHHLVALCPTSSQLEVIDLRSGAVVATRRLAFAQTTQASSNVYDDSIKLSELDGVIVVGHLDSRGPRLDAYRADGLTPLWSIPFFDSAIIQPCHEIFCMSDGRISTGLDPHTGKALPFPGFDPALDEEVYSGPGPASVTSKLALIPSGAERGTYPGGLDGFDVQNGYSNASSVATYPDSTVIGVPGSTRVTSWIASVRVQSRQRGEIAITPVQRLAGVGVQSCVLVDPYLACAISRQQLDIYDVRKLTRNATG